MKKKAADPSKPPEQPLVGSYFHSIKDGQVHWQGCVLSRPEPGIYLIQLFEWLMGEANVQRLMRIDEMHDWLFYATGDEMTFSYDYGTAREGGLYRKKIKVD